MTMKKTLLILLALLTFGSQVKVAAVKKEKKEKKELKWDWDGTLSKNEEINKYLLKIDTLYKKVQAYKEDFGTCNLNDSTTLYDEATGKLYKLAYMTNGSGQMVTRARVNWQFAQAYAEGALIILDMTSAGLMSANAALTLPKLGLDAFKFGKYVKGGPLVISEGTKSIKTIRGLCMSNSRTWKSMKDGAIEDASTLGLKGISPGIAEKLNKCAYIKEVRQDDPEYPELIAKYRNMTSEEIASKYDSVIQVFADSTILPEDEMKKADELPDVDEELKKLEGNS